MESRSNFKILGIDRMKILAAYEHDAVRDLEGFKRFKRIWKLYVLPGQLDEPKTMEILTTLQERPEFNLWVERNNARLNQLDTEAYKEENDAAQQQ
jgi:hypothetical protein